MAKKKPQGPQDTKKDTKQPITGKKESTSTTAKKIPKEELVALRVTQEMMSQCKQFIQVHGSVRAPLAAMLEADGCALSGDLDEFLFYASVSTLCVIHLMLCSEGTTMIARRTSGLVAARSSPLLTMTAATRKGPRRHTREGISQNPSASQGASGRPGGYPVKIRGRDHLSRCKQERTDPWMLMMPRLPLRPRR
jgi:hypothetical protein